MISSEAAAADPAVSRSSVRGAASQHPRAMFDTIDRHAWRRHIHIAGQRQ
jgi:hypothetical protein